MTLEQDMRAWDQKSRNEIQAIYERHSHEPLFIDQTIENIGVDGSQVAASWLLKHCLETGDGTLLASETKRLIKQLHHVSSWQTKLHILQSIQYLAIPAEQTEALEAFLRACLFDDVKFVRAWAYSGLYELAVQFPDYRVTVEPLLERGTQAEEAASVRARIRKCLKKGF